MNRRFLFVRLPYFPIERFLKVQAQAQYKTKPWWDEQAHQESDETAAPKGPLVLVRHNAKGTRISAASPQAEENGIWTGMKLTDARAMVPELNVEQHDESADLKTLARFAYWMQRYSPAVAIHETDGFVLDTQGCSHLFGGESAMAKDIEQRFAALGFSTRLAFADSVAASLALVKHGAKRLHILPKNCPLERLDMLPVEALRLEDDTVLLLRRLGLKRLGDVRKLPRAALERRFREDKKSRSKIQTSNLAKSVQWRLDQMSGLAPEPLRYIREPRRFCVRRPCPELALEQGAVGIALDELLPDLCQLLEKAHQGARHFRLTGYRADGGSSSVGVSLSQASNNTKIVRRLFTEKLDHIDCGYGIDLFTLDAHGTQALQADQHDMVDPVLSHSNSASIATFSDIVSNRVGINAVSRLSPHTSHVPERTQRFSSINSNPKWHDWKAVQPIWAPRPIRLFMKPEPADVTAEMPDSPPAQFVWRRVLRRVVRSRGPERILPEWWRDNFKAKRGANFRDYYDVEDSNGMRYWIFRSIKEEPLTSEASTNDTADEDQKNQPEMLQTTHWYVHGLF